MARPTSTDVGARGSGLLPTIFLLGGLLAATVYVTAGSPTISAIAFCTVGLGSAGALAVGIRRYRPAPRWPWGCLAAACLTFLLGALLRNWAADQEGIAQLASDGFTIPGYALMFVGLGGFLLARKGIKRHAVIDGLLVGVGAVLIFAVLFAIPAATIEGRSAAVSTLAGIYPLLDGILVLLVLNLAFTTARQGPSYFMLIGCMALLLVGDIAYAVIGTDGKLSGYPLLDLPFLLGFTLIGASALHPSMTRIGNSASLPVQAWSVRRLLLITPALAVPFVLIVMIDRFSLIDRVIVAIGGALAVALLMVRAVSAVHDYAAAQRRYEYQATHDPLTGLANRALFFAQVRTMLAQRSPPDQPLWVYFLDLDGFKLVNDSRGHTAGDQVIVEVARRLRLSAPDAQIARVGGDEFVIAYRAARPEAILLAEAILQAMRQTLRMPAADVVVTVSIGIAHSSTPESDATAESLLRDADTAMYQAKATGRDTWVVFDPIMRARVQERIDMHLALREALAQEQFRLAFQPIVHLASGRIRGAEALIRWDHPVRGAIPPDAFIPVAEESGVIIEIGRWVIHGALRQLAVWRERGVVSDDFWLSINVSPRQLRDPQLCVEVAAALEQYGVSGSAVMIELTESVMIDPTSGADQALSTLRELGVQLVVDDFGTGFSALGYLRKYPVTGVKIDRSFVAGLGVNPEDEEIVRAVVAMSAALKLSVVAEGVQDRSQQSVLSGLGVIYGQGWLWGRPVDAASFELAWSMTSANR
ncbi:diguanylate cyclase (GGDEF)-like protein [Allocatelliglobosispora scoriae]|uniref:Diguanylate cyclase (GGDEF)-like protein n=1 Tax=Allocatelliglobosispora scoriae TaxID=643052 RepID=A0A841C5Q6_9ACTN|nr:EAL domain-containing protein [Allocatelliglobosispora scoriae]MBB5874402.1 diguanylate cyclase (GGDEF)-like protein [Allocatelliglobosispora scoriae]